MSLTSRNFNNSCNANENNNRIFEEAYESDTDTIQYQLAHRSSISGINYDRPKIIITPIISRDEQIELLNLRLSSTTPNISTNRYYLKNKLKDYYLREERKRRASEIKIRFNKYLKNWKKEKMFISSTSDIIYNESYQKIIGLGKPAIPLILNELNKDPDLFFWALYCITDENPVHPEHSGSVVEMALDWLQWGKEKGYI